MSTSTKTKTNTFPWVLHEMLETAHEKGFDGIVSWLKDGKSFKVHDPASFVEKIMRKFFQQSKYKSFQRQLNLWGFQRIAYGPNKGGYYHPEGFFIREKRCKIHMMQRQRIKGCVLKDKSNKNAKIDDDHVEKGNITEIDNTVIEASGAASIISQGSLVDINNDALNVGRDSAEPFLPPLKSLQSSISDEESSSLLQLELKDEFSIDPEVGDCIGFAGRSFFFTEEEAVENTPCTVSSSMTLARRLHPQQRVALPPVSVLLPNTYLCTANMMSQISRRRVSIGIFGAACKPTTGC